MSPRRRRVNGLALAGYALSLGTIALLAVALGVGQTAASTVPATRASDTSQAITANTLKPAACAALALTTLRTGNGNIDPGFASATADLILGGPAAQTIRGRGGDDCILGGGGNDTLRGDGGTDVCIGGPGADGFNADCETQIQ